jgi:hypothetical protein
LRLNIFTQSEPLHPLSKTLTINGIDVFSVNIILIRNDVNRLTIGRQHQFINFKRAIGQCRYFIVRKVHGIGLLPTCFFGAKNQMIVGCPHQLLFARVRLIGLSDAVCRPRKNRSRFARFEVHDHN